MGAMKTFNLDQVRKLSMGSNHPLHHHVVFAVKGGAVVAVGVNNNYRHAEVVALSQLWPNKRKGVKVYSFRWLKSGRLGQAKPCEDCEKYLRKNGVKTVYYSDSVGQIQKMKL